MGRERRERKSEGRKKRREENRQWAAASSPPAWVSAVRRGERRWGTQKKSSCPPHPIDSPTQSPKLHDGLTALGLKKDYFPCKDTAVSYPIRSSQAPTPARISCVFNPSQSHASKPEPRLQVPLKRHWHLLRLVSSLLRCLCRSRRVFTLWHKCISYLFHFEKNLFSLQAGTALHMV